MTDPSREQLMAALRRADAADDTEAARAIARRIQAMATPDFSNVQARTTHSAEGYEPYKPTPVDKPAPAAPPKEQQGEFMRGLLLGGRSTLEGIAGIPDLIGKPLEWALEKTVGPQMNFTDMATALSDKMGLPKAENAQERVTADIGRAISGGAVTMGAGGAMANAPGTLSTLTGRLGTMLSASPKMQALSAATGAGASGLTREGGYGPGAQLAAGLIGGLAPSGLPAAGQASIRGLLRGGETGRQALADSVDEFARVGSTPTVGQGAGNARSRFGEGILRSAPGSAGVVRNRLEQQADEVGQGVERVANTLSPAAGAERGGRAIVNGITGPSGFMTRFRNESNRLYAELGNRLPRGTQVQATETQRTLADLTTPIPGAANTSGLLQNPRINAIAQAFGDDLAASGGTMPYEAVTRLRTMVGEAIGDSALAPDSGVRQLRRVYASLSDDMTNAALATGDPRAIQAARRANTYYRAGMARVDDIERVVDRNGGPEAVYKAMFVNSMEGGSTIRKVMQSLDGPAQRDLAAVTLRRLGRARPSAQDELGEVFNPETYLTNWSRMAPEAKRALFDRFGPNFSRDTDTVAAAVAKIRKANQTLPNPSGSAVVAGQVGAFGGLALNLLSGNPGMAAGIATTIAATNLGARVMTNPWMVNWLARSTTLPAAAAPSQLAILAARAKEDEDAADAYRLFTESQRGGNP